MSLSWGSTKRSSPSDVSSCTSRSGLGRLGSRSGLSTWARLADTTRSGAISTKSTFRSLFNMVSLTSRVRIRSPA